MASSIKFHTARRNFVTKNIKGFYGFLQSFLEKVQQCKGYSSLLMKQRTVPCCNHQRSNNDNNAFSGHLAQ
jgi:hypothetical protein